MHPSVMEKVTHVKFCFLFSIHLHHFWVFSVIMDYCVQEFELNLTGIYFVIRL